MSTDNPFTGLSPQSGRVTINRRYLDLVFKNGASDLINSLGEGSFHLEITADEIKIGHLSAAIKLVAAPAR